MSPSSPALASAGRAKLVFPVACGLLLVAFTYFLGLGWTGLLGPDEPRYASIGREMAESGDWITPRLWGQAWFEKPALLYWLIGTGHSVGLKAEWAARIPVAALSVLFLAFYYFALARLAGPRTASIATILLSTCGGWIAFSQVAATDLPLAATFAGGFFAMLLAREVGWRLGYPMAGICFGLALLAKGLVPAVLAALLLFFFRREWRAVLRVGLIAGIVAAVWYGPMLWYHGHAFFDDFFIKHHLGRFSSPDLQHVQPMWFYLPVLAGWLYPWPILILLAAFSRGGRPHKLGEWARIALWTAAFGFVFFSLSTNKLPGYVLPLLPLVVAVSAGRIDQCESERRGLLWTGFLLFLIPVAASVLPQALLHGITNVDWNGVPWEYLALSVAAGVVAQWLAAKGRRIISVAFVGVLVLGGLAYIKITAFPVLDQVVSARGLANRVKAARREVCVDSLHRSLRYGLNYYVRPQLEDCETKPSGLRIVQPKGAQPALAWTGQ